MKIYNPRWVVVMAIVVVGLAFANCEGDDDDEKAGENKPKPCESTPEFDDLTDGEYEWFGELCADAGVEIGVLEFRYSADRKRFSLKGTYSSESPPHYAFSQNAGGDWCYVEMNGGSFEVAVEYEYCTDDFSLDVMSRKPDRFYGTWSDMNVVCPFSVRALPVPSDCEEQPAGEDD